MKTNEVNKISESEKFRINSSFKEFTDRQKNVFDQLNIVESNTKHVLSNNSNYIEEENNSMQSEIHKDVKMRQYQGKESIFKKPEPRLHGIRKPTKVPDFRKNPQKWTKYSLDDVCNEDMSEQSNTKAALSFLNELKSRKSMDTEEVDEEQVSQKIVFKKISRVQNNAQPSTTAFQQSKVVMPEYVIGQKREKEKKRRLETCRTDSGKAVKLGHLDDDDDLDES